MCDLSVVIVSFNTRDLLSRCLRAVEEAGQGLSVQIVVVDNGSTDGSIEMLADDYPQVDVIVNTTNTGFAAANNQGMTLAVSDTYLLLNSDAFITGEAIRRALDVLRRRPDVGMVGVRLIDDDGSFQAGAGRFPTLWDDISRSLGIDRLQRSEGNWASGEGAVDWIQGACMFVRASAVRETGGLDTHFFMYSEEVDWCWRFRQHGWAVWYMPDVDVVHLGGASSTTHDISRRVSLYTSRLSLRRRLGGATQSLILWLAMVLGMLARIVFRSVAGLLARRDVGNQSASSDLALLKAILQVDPLARESVA